MTEAQKLYDSVMKLILKSAGKANNIKIKIELMKFIVGCNLSTYNVRNNWIYKEPASQLGASSSQFGFQFAAEFYLSYFYVLCQLVADNYAPTLF